VTRGLTAVEVGEPPRVVRLTPVGRLFRYGSWAMWVAGCAMGLAITWVLTADGTATPDGQQRVLALVAIVGTLFLSGAFIVAGIEWLIRRERRAARHWAAADVVFSEDDSRRICYGLTDEAGRPFPFSPPISELDPEVLAARERKTVLYDPRQCRRLIDVRHLRFVRIDGLTTTQ
jgi:hypothetical protein